MASYRQHAFLSPAFNSWAVWTKDGTETLTNPGASHRELESLAYAIDKMGEMGWDVQSISVDGGRPTLVLLVREVESET
jgi:hypothetical protein